MEYLPGLKKVFVIVLSISVSLFVFVMLFFNNDYFENKFVIKLNDININARYKSEFYELLFVKNASEGYIELYNKPIELFNKTQVSDKYVLSFNEYSAYNKYNNRESYTVFNPSVKYKKVNNSQNTLKIERLNKVLYDGPFINDISKYIEEEGRYYFHIYNISKRTSSPIAKVKTTLTFNVLVVNDEKQD